MTITANQRFGRLVAVSRANNNGRHARWLCQCDCGRAHIVLSDSLTCGRTRSCGCLRDETSRKRMTRHGHTSWKKGSSHTYQSWASAKSRCFSQTNQDFADYGGRGITMCDEWRQDFAAFLRDMGERPPRTELDRINNAGNYEPGNCRWATRTQQMRNVRDNRRYEWQGQNLTVSEWAERIGLPSATLKRRLQRGWTVEETMTKPLVLDLKNRKRETKPRRKRRHRNPLTGVLE